MNETNRFCDSTRSFPRTGFTIVEILAVISIMAVLAGMILGGAAYAQRKAAVTRAQADLQRIARGLDEYRAQFGGYPTGSVYVGEIRSNRLADILTGKTNVLRKIDPDLVFEDPWGRGYIYTNALRYSYELLSHGPREKDSNGNYFTADDISNRRNNP